MKIAVTSTGPTLDNDVEARFGRCSYFLIIDTETMNFEAIENPNIALGGGAGIQSAQLMSEKGVKSILTGNCGPNAFSVFGQAGIQVIVGVSGNIRNAVEQFKAGRFASADSPNVQSHFGIGSGQQPDQAPFSDLVNPGMDNRGAGNSRGGGRGRGMGGCRGKGRGMGSGRGMGRGMGMGIRAAIPNSPASLGVFQPTNFPTGGLSELDQLKQQANILQQQKQEMEKRISALEIGCKAVAFVNAEKCNGCGICMDVCPVNAIEINQKAKVNEEICNSCATCISECPNEAIKIIQRKFNE